MKPDRAPVLITIAISLFNDFARWSLDRCGIRYREKRHAMIVHALASRLAGGGGTTPTLRTAEGVLSDSVAIAEWADAETRRRGTGLEIYPDPGSPERGRADVLVARLTSELGPATRRIPWQHLIDHPDLAAHYWAVGIPGWERLVQPWALRVARPLTIRAVGITAERLAAAPATIDSAFEEIAAILADGRPYLLGEHLSVADICFAAMASPAVCPTEGHPVPHYQPEDFPSAIGDRIRAWREHPAGRYTLRMYREHREGARP